MASKATVERWSRLVERYEASGQSLRAFASSVDVNPGTLSWWRRHLQSHPSGFIEVDLSSAAAGPPLPSAPEPGSSPASTPRLAVELVSRGLRVEVPAEADLVWLRRVVEALC